MATKANPGVGRRNGSTTHPRKSRRREGALARLPALVPVPEPRAAKAKPARILKGRGSVGVLDGIEGAVLARELVTAHEKDLLEANARDIEWAKRNNARVTAERAVLEARIGRPPRSWPKKTKPVTAVERLASEQTVLDNIMQTPS